MSKLNDALKRASQTDRERQRPVAARANIEPAADPRGKSLAKAMVAGSVLALGLALWFFWQLFSASYPHAVANVEPAPIAAPKPAPTPVVRAEVPTPPVVIPTPAPVVAPAPTPVAAPAPAPVVAAPAKPVEPAWPANLKLTGIFFRKTNPLALLNGKTVGVGDEIDGIRVAKIESDRVTLEWNGKIKEMLVNGGGN
jgi:hypothetical protein